MSNLYLISQDKNNEYDTYDSCVVVADSEDEARLITPRSFYNLDIMLSAWALPEHITVKLIGTAADGFAPGQVVCASFNAG